MRNRRSWPGPTGQPARQVRGRVPAVTAEAVAANGAGPDAGTEGVAGTAGGADAGAAEGTGACAVDAGPERGPDPQPASSTPLAAATAAARCGQDRRGLTGQPYMRGRTARPV